MYLFKLWPNRLSNGICGDFVEYFRDPLCTPCIVVLYSRCPSVRHIISLFGFYRMLWSIIMQLVLKVYESKLPLDEIVLGCTRVMGLKSVRFNTIFQYIFNWLTSYTIWSLLRLIKERYFFRLDSPLYLRHFTTLSMLFNVIFYVYLVSNKFKNNWLWRTPNG